MSTDELAEQDTARLCRTASQLYGDLIQLFNVQPDSAIEQQALQLIADAFETVGLMAMEVRSRYDTNWPPTEAEFVPHGQEIPRQVDLNSSPQRCDLAVCNRVDAHYHPSAGGAADYIGSD